MLTNFFLSGYLVASGLELEKYFFILPWLNIGTKHEAVGMAQLANIFKKKKDS